jgi:hypothetical protein
LHLSYWHGEITQHYPWDKALVAFGKNSDAQQGRTERLNLTPLRGGLFLNYETRENARKRAKLKREPFSVI